MPAFTGPELARLGFGLLDSTLGERPVDCGGEGSDEPVEPILAPRPRSRRPCRRCKTPGVEAGEKVRFAIDT